MDNVAGFFDKLKAWIEACASHAVTSQAHAERKDGATDKVLATSKANVATTETAVKDHLIPPTAES